MDLIKNPIVLGSLACILTYVIIRYNTKPDNDDKNKNNNNIILFILSILVGILVWSIMSKIIVNNVPSIDISESDRETNIFIGGGSNDLSNEKMILEPPDF